MPAVPSVFPVTRATLAAVPADEEICLFTLVSVCDDRTNMYHHAQQTVLKGSKLTYSICMLLASPPIWQTDQNF